MEEQQKISTLNAASYFDRISADGSLTYHSKRLAHTELDVLIVVVTVSSNRRMSYLKRVMAALDSQLKKYR